MPFSAQRTSAALAGMIALLGVAGSACSAGTEEQTRPMAAAERWTPPAISSTGYEASPTFTPDGQTMFYIASDPNFSTYKVMQSRCGPDGWGKPETPSFAVPLPVIEADPFVTHDGKRLYYISSRHSPKDQDFDIWFVDRTKDGGWGEPQRLPEPVNSKGAELLPRTDGEGRLYFGSDRPGGQGKGDIYVATQDAVGQWSVSNVGPPISTAAFEYEVEVSRDAKTMITVTDRGDRSHLYHYERGAKGWTEIGKIPAKEDVFQVGPLLSPKGDRLLFAQKDGERSGEMFVMDLKPGADRSWPPNCR